MKQIILNSIKTPDGTILTSHYRHDYKEYKDKNGLIYMVDGGDAYLRRNKWIKEPYKELSQYLSEDHSHNREYFSWGTYGKSGKEPLKYILLKDMDTDHIEAVLETQHQLKNTYVENLFFNEINYRLTLSK